MNGQDYLHNTTVKSNIYNNIRLGYGNCKSSREIKRLKIDESVVKSSHIIMKN